MHNLVSVKNLSINELLNTDFHVSIFASGYESRASYLARKINKRKCGNILVFGFKEKNQLESRKINDQFFKTLTDGIININSQEEKEIYATLIHVFEAYNDVKEVNVLVDYTSMSRIWYSGILNFFRLQNVHSTINVYLNYSLGAYKEDLNLLDYSYSSINSIPSHEGSLSSNNKTTLVLGVGFSPYLIKSVIEEIEPNYIIGILPVPNIKERYQEKSEKIKNDILTRDIDKWINCSVSDLEAIFRTYAEITNDCIHTQDILFLSLGPKIFTIASLLVAQRFPQVTCLYLRTNNSRGDDVTASGDCICSKIVYKNE